MAPQLDPATIRDDLSTARTSGSAAARLSGDHLSRLTYDTGAADLHTAPYGAQYDPNYQVGSKQPEEPKGQ
jgi:hypothetical protein